MATATLPNAAKVHHPRCPHSGRGIEGVPEWTTERVQDLVAGSLVLDSCGFCGDWFKEEPPSYAPPPAVLTRKPSPRPRPPEPQEEQMRSTAVAAPTQGGTP